MHLYKVCFHAKSDLKEKEKTEPRMPKRLSQKLERKRRGIG